MTASPAIAALLAFVLALLLRTAGPRGTNAAAYVSLGGGVIGMIGAAGSLYGAPPLYAIPGHPALSWLAAVAIVALAAGLLVTRPHSSLVAPFFDRHAGGVMSRRLLPWLAILPFVVGLIRLRGQRAGFYDAALGLAVFSTTNVILFACLIWWSARRLNRSAAETEAAHHEARAAVAISEARYRRLAESLPQLIWTSEPDGFCDYLSPQWIAYTGVPASQQLGTHWEEQLHPDDRLGAAAQWAWSVKSGEPLDFEGRVRRHDGIYRWFRALAVPVRDEGGAIVKWFGSATDMEDRKLAEADLHDITAELERRVDERTRELRIAKEQAESADRLKTDFIMSMSHELRTPLNAIIGFTGTLLTKLPGPLNAEQEKQLRYVQSGSRHLLSIITDVLDVARIESGGLMLEDEPVDAVALVRTVAAELEPLAAEKGLPLHADVPPEPIVIRSDARALKQVLINLASNAVKFTERGAVTLSAARLDGGQRVALSVTDTGIGIAAEDQSRLFVKFGRLQHVSQATTGGTGLGLYLTRMLTDRLGASVEVDSRPGGGSRFTVTVPKP